MAREAIFSKWNLKDYHNELEKILEEKKFSSDVKNLLLSMLYKIEVGYEDYTKIKTDVKSKKEFMEDLIQKIKQNCDEIILIKPEMKEKSEILSKEKYEIFPEEKRIIVYPNEKNLLEAICKISNHEMVINEKYGIWKKVLEILLLTGNNMNEVEVIRDFNGWSWSTLAGEMENIPLNILYQDLRILVGNAFLEQWIHNKIYIMDYWEMFRDKIEESYGKEIYQEYIRSFCKAAIIVISEKNTIISDTVEKKCNELEEEIERIKDKSKYLQELSDKRKEQLKIIEKIDELLNRRNLLEKEFVKRSEEEKIFSVAQFEKILERERVEAVEKRKELEEKMNPKKFVEKCNELQKKYEFFKEIEEKDIKETILELQEKELECFLRKIKKIENKREMIEWIYKIRYFQFIPLDKHSKMRNVEELKEKNIRIQQVILAKAREEKIITDFSNDKEINFEILREIFELRMVELENLEVEIQKKDNSYLVFYYDGEELENTKTIETTQIKANKLNKRIKIFG